MATSANVRKTPQGEKLFFFSRYYDIGAKGIDLFQQDVGFIQQAYCFPPIPIIGMVLRAASLKLCSGHYGNKSALGKVGIVLY